MKQSKLAVWMILGVLFIMAFTLVYERVSFKDFNPDNLSINQSKFNELKYHITVDCKELLNPESTTTYVRDIVVNQSKMSEICKGIFPDLIKEAKE